MGEERCHKSNEWDKREASLKSC